MAIKRTTVKTADQDVSYDILDDFAELLNAEDPLHNASSTQTAGRGQAITVPDAKTFVMDYCQTLDPKDRTNPIKPFPRDPYLTELIDLWLTSDYLLVPKSRQMMASWLFVALHLWYMLSAPGRIIFFISKIEGDAGFANQLSLLSRAYFMFERLPAEMKPPIQTGIKPPVIRAPLLNSEMQGLSQTSDAIRMYSASAVLWDEMAFHENAYKTYAAMIPTIQGGGKITGISTPNGKRENLFFDLCFDVGAEKEKMKYG